MPIRVLVVDDHALVREGTRSMLEQNAEIEVIGEAADGAEALELTAELLPDVVVIDVVMPHVNGIEATRQIKERCPATAVLALSAYDDDAYVFALLEAGAAGYLLKSAPRDELATAVRAVHSGGSILSPSVASRVLAKFTGAVERSSGAGSEVLTERERDILRIVARGLPNKAIAEELCLSPRTVELHLAHVFDKLGVASRTEAVVAGLKRGWLRLEEIE